MKKISLFPFVALAFAFTLQASAQSGQIGGFIAQALRPAENCVVPKVDGERVPFPIQKANTKFELSEGETYLLNGTLVVMDGQVYFKLDLEIQPWLATARVVQFPYFLVDTVSMGTVKHLQGRLVQVAVVAHRMAPANRPGDDIKLNSILPPVLL